MTIYEDKLLEGNSYEKNPIEKSNLDYSLNEEDIILQDGFRNTKEEVKQEIKQEIKAVVNKEESAIKNPRELKTKKSIEYIEHDDYSSKTWGVTLVLCILLGFIGFHRFYVGKAGTAILMLLTFGGFGIWVLVDLIRIIINNFTDEEGKIVKRNSLAS